MKTAILLGIGLLVLAVQFSTATEIVCKSPFQIGRNATDCSKWFICLLGYPVRRSCSAGYVFSFRKWYCVKNGSVNDDCLLTEPPSPVDQCKAGSVQKVFAKPDNCAQFYNCSLKPSTPGPGYLGDYIDECPYPKLFSKITRKCEIFLFVYCGSRKEIKYACNYRKLQCPVSHCISCSAYYPDCRGLSDGLHVWKEWGFSPYYALCYQNRGFPKTCPSIFGRTQLFSPITRTCLMASGLFH